MLNQNLFYLIPLVGSADKLIQVPAVKASITSRILSLEGRLLASKEAHICEVYKHVFFFAPIFLRSLFSILLYQTA